jgi:hypothetical protein
MVRLKFGQLVDKVGHRQYVTNAVLGKIFKVSASKIRQLLMGRFEKVRVSKLSLLERLQMS